MKIKKLNHSNFETGSIYIFYVLLVVIIIFVGYLIVTKGYINITSILNYKTNTNSPIAMNTKNNLAPTPDYSKVIQTNDAKVEISNKTFSPSSLQVKVGSTVTWYDTDIVSFHQIAVHQVFNDGSNLVSDKLTAGQSFSFTFSNPGNYSYSDNSVSSSLGYIIVVN